jgi:hypothetical protein
VAGAGGGRTRWRGESSENGTAVRTFIMRVPCSTMMPDGCRGAGVSRVLGGVGAWGSKASNIAVELMSQ